VLRLPFNRQGGRVERRLQRSARRLEPGGQDRR
jgi:hypothetical protein